MTIIAIFFTLFFLCLILLIKFKLPPQVANIEDCLVGWIVGFIFAFGLIISGMIKREKVIGFLALGSKWDPTLFFVLLCAAGPNFITFHFILKNVKPRWAEKFDVNKNTQIDWKLCVGALIFGLGWGFGGICPGPAFVLISMNVL